MSKAQLRHLLLDINFKDKAKVIDLEESFCPLARLLFIDVLCAMSGATEGKITRATIRHLGKRIALKLPKIEDIIDFCVKTEMFFEVDNFLTNERVLKDQQSLQNKRNNALERQRKYVDKRVNNASITDNPQASTTRFPDPVSVSDTEYINNKNGEKIKILDFLEFDEISLDTFKAQLGEKRFQRACQKLNGWIGQKQNTAEFEERLQHGRNPGFAFQNWVIAAIEKESGGMPVTEKVSAVELLRQRKFKEQVEGLENGK
jgi:hypothetical protein